MVAHCILEYALPKYTRQKGCILGLLTEYCIIPKQLSSTEIIKEVEKNGENLTELLQINVEQLEPTCLSRALTAAVRNNHHQNVGKLIVKGANPTLDKRVITEALTQSENEKKPHARAMLLLVKAAMENNVNLVLLLFSEPPANEQEAYYEERRAVSSGDISTAIPIEIARKHKNAPVREELLLKTDVHRLEKSVYWNGLKLLSLEVSWLHRIHWVEKLIMAQNGLKTLPGELELLKHVSDRFGCSVAFSIQKGSLF